MELRRRPSPQRKQRIERQSERRVAKGKACREMDKILANINRGLGAYLLMVGEPIMRKVER